MKHHSSRQSKPMAVFGGCLLLAAVSSCPQGMAQDATVRPKDSTWLLPVAEIKVDEKIPTLEKVVGHRWAQEISSHAEIERYLNALAKAAPERCRLIKYGQSYEGKDLYNLVITSPENLKKLEQIREQNQALADPRVTSVERAREIAANAPAIVFLAYCVHGNEVSPSDAALVTAYHLLADRRPETRELLEKLVVVIDPLQNPDGRDRFVLFHRETRGAYDQDHPLASDRLERWPGGRFNHYLFDMNRDWFLHTQKESAARVAAFLRWKPQIFVDAHEMGPNSTFFFDPASEPYSPHTLSRQRDWHMKIGRTHAEHFDRNGFAYTNREMFDAFGPQYGSTWPTLHGSIGILWEQAGVRGRVISRQDQTKLYYHDGVRHHYISGLATLEAAAKDRQQLLLDFHSNAADSVKLGESGPTRAFFLLEGKRPARAAALAQLLLRNGIEVRRATSAAKVQAADILNDKSQEQAIPAGCYYIPLNQPAARLALTLLERHQDMGAEYLKRQEARVKRGLPDQIYDATSWSLPLAYGVPCLAASGTVEIASEPAGNGALQGKIVGKKPRVGYLLSGDDDKTLPALCQWLGQGLRVHVLSEPTKINGVNFPRGSLLLRVAENPDSLHDAVASGVKTHGLTVHAIDNAFVDEGASLGGPNVRWTKPPRVLLMVDRPASYTVGHTWYLFDQVWRYPVTRVAGRMLPQVDWNKFDVLIMPQGLYMGEDAPSEDSVRRIKDWVRDGGTVILVGGAAAWATGDKVKLLASKLEKRKGDDDKPRPEAGKKDDKDKLASDADKKDDKPSGRPPLRVPGVFLKAKVDDDHFVTWGTDQDPALFYSGNLVFAPLKEIDGKNLIAFGEQKDLLVSGYCWPQTLQMLPGRPYALYQPLGRGHVIAFADDPNYRAFSPQLQRLFFNAVFFGPAR
ncbi:MAG: hypothetical protein HY040_26510 [Planctomycetes bacterium]|nr:hypothetical protein [Planctomycetota bacterium]